MNQIHCPTCESVIKESWNYCTICRTKLKEERKMVERVEDLKVEVPKNVKPTKPDLIKGLEIYIEEKAQYHFENALQKSKTIGDLYLYTNEEMDLYSENDSILEVEVKKIVKRKFRRKVESFVRNQKISTTPSKE